jgi:lipopolysaccharide transport system ATP-binding protein
MIMRLGFALATATPPEVLIVDEALAVGDAGFQQKCLKRFYEFQSRGTTTLIVSHDLSLLSQLCTRILVMEKGKLVYDGEPISAIQEYMKIIAGGSTGQGSGFLKHLDAFESWNWEIFRGDESYPNLAFVGEELRLVVQFCPKTRIEQLTIGFHLDDSRGVRAFGTNSLQLGEELRSPAVGKMHTLEFRIPLNLGTGKYSLGLSIHEGESHANNCYYWEEGLHSFELERVSVSKFVGIAYLPVELSYSQDP